MILTDGVSQRFWSNGPAHAPPCKTIGLGNGVNGYGPISHAGERGDTDMFGSIVKDMLVNLISHCNDTPFQAKIGNELELFKRKDFTGGVVRCVDDDSLCLVIKCLGQFLLIEMPVWFMEGDESGLRITEDSIRTIILVKRFEYNNLLSGINDGHQGRDHGLRCPAADCNLFFGIYSDTIIPNKFLGNGLTKIWGSPGEGVLV